MSVPLFQPCFTPARRAGGRPGTRGTTRRAARRRSAPALGRWWLAVCAVVGAMTMDSAIAPAQEMRVIRIATGGLGSDYFPFGGLVANAVSNPPGSRPCNRGGSCGVPGLIAVAQSTAGSQVNMFAVDTGGVEMGIARSDVLGWGQSGTGPYALAGRPAYPDLRAIARLYDEAAVLVVREDGPAGIEDLRGKTVSVGEDGSGVPVTFALLRAAHGLAPEDVTLRHLGPVEALDALAAKKIDAAFLLTGHPSAVLTGALRTHAFRVLPLDGPVARKVAASFPWYHMEVLPKGLYGLPDAAVSLGASAVLFVRADMADDLAYGITRAILHEKARPVFVNGHALGEEMDIYQAEHRAAIPLHPGAARYYAEKRTSGTANR